MPHYYADVDPALRNTTHTLILEMVGGDKDVLDVGCASGYLAKVLKDRGCRVSGIEYVPEEAEKARPLLEKLVIDDLMDIDMVGEFGAASFDKIVFGDVLEHLPDPLAVLRKSVPLLRPGGNIIISLPNVAHGSLRLALLQGRWNYTPTGLLDATHLRFFTRETLQELLSDAGLLVEELRGTMADPLECEVKIDDGAVPPNVVSWVREQPYAMVYQFVVRAAVGDPTTPWPELVPSIVVPVVDDLHRHRSESGAELPEGVVEERDALRVETVELYRNIVRLDAQAQSTLAEIIKAVNEQRATQARLDAASAEIADLKASLSWRVGRSIVRPASWVRGRLRGDR
ncbi:MAG: methyltransferase domain-containing protein [Propionibacteriaceae bacterium]